MYNTAAIGFVFPGERSKDAKLYNCYAMSFSVDKERGCLTVGKKIMQIKINDPRLRPQKVK